jgi:hypothetical protein
MHSSYSSMCDHYRTVRIDEHFDRCLKCGQSFVNPSYSNVRNKTRHDFTKENKRFTRNFDRNFSNVIEEVDTYIDEPRIEYYTDRTQTNLAKLDRNDILPGDPQKYKIIINGQSAYLELDRIKQLFADAGVFRIDGDQYETLYAYKYNNTEYDFN